MTDPAASPAPAPSRPTVTFTMPAPPRRRKWARFVILGLVSVILILTSMNVMLGSALAFLTHSPQRFVNEDVLSPGKAGQQAKIVVLPVEGTVNDDMVERMRIFVDHVKDDPNVKAVILEINSPGGGITASDEIHHLFTDLRTKYQKKLVVSMRTLAASGGYYVAVPAEKIYAQPTTLTGSIGVIWPAFEVTGMLDKIGVTPEVIKSDQANDFKDAGSPLHKFTDKDREYIKGLVNNAHQRFRKIVEDGRKGKLAVSIDEIAIGKIWTAEEAKAKGLVDEIAYPDQIVAAVAAEAGLSDPKVVRLKKRGGLLDALTASSPFGSTHVELKLDPSTLQQVQDAAAGRLEYRYAGPTP